MGSEATLGIIKISVCASSQGISIPMAFYKLVVTQGERSKISITNAYRDSEEDDEDDEDTKATVDAEQKPTITSEDDEPNLDGLMDE